MPSLRFQNDILIFTEFENLRKINYLCFLLLKILDMWIRGKIIDVKIHWIPFIEFFRLEVN